MRDRIVFVAYDGMTVLDLVGPYEVLSMWPDAEIVVAAQAAGVVMPDSRALPVVANATLADIDHADIVVVPGGPTPEEAAHQKDLHRWIARVAGQARCILSVCTGAFHLGGAGLLAGKKATTHWAVIDSLAPFGAVPQRARWVDEGAVVTAAGVSAGIDAALYLTARERSPELARAIQLMIEYDPAPPFGAEPLHAAATLADVVQLLGPVMAARRR